jgi:hypothetical protein
MLQAWKLFWQKCQDVTLPNRRKKLQRFTNKDIVDHYWTKENQIKMLSAH